EVDDVLAGLRQRGGAGEHGEGIFLAEAVEGGDGLEHGSGFRRQRGGDVGVDEIFAGKEQWQIAVSSDRVDEAIAEIELGRMAAAFTIFFRSQSGEFPLLRLNSNYRNTASPGEL